MQPQFVLLVFTVLFQRSFRKRRQFYENCCYIYVYEWLVCCPEGAKIWITLIWISHLKKIHHKIQSLQIPRFGQIFAKRAVPKIAQAEPSRAEKLPARAESELSQAELSSGASLITSHMMTVLHFWSDAVWKTSESQEILSKWVLCIWKLGIQNRPFWEAPFS